MSDQESEAEGERSEGNPPDGSLNARASLTKFERVNHIAELMAGHQWVTGLTGRRLAEEWGISYDCVRHDAAEASRSFKVDPVEREHLQARWFAKLESAQDAVRAIGKPEALAPLLKLEGDHLDVFAAQKVDLNVSGSDEQLTRRVAALLAGAEADPDPEPADSGGETSH